MCKSLIKNSLRAIFIIVLLAGVLACKKWTLDYAGIKEEPNKEPKYSVMFPTEMENASPDATVSKVIEPSLP